MRPSCGAPPLGHALTSSSTAPNDGREADVSPDAAGQVDGNTLIAESLKNQGIDSLFGIVGYPVYGVASAAQKAGLRYFGFRNEQAASYAAGAVGYLTGRPGACLTVSGPGMVHAIAGLSNAWANCWPMILLGGANDSYLRTVRVRSRRRRKSKRRGPL